MRNWVGTKWRGFWGSKRRTFLDLFLVDIRLWVLRLLRGWIKFGLRLSKLRSRLLLRLRAMERKLLLSRLHHPWSRNSRHTR